MLLAADDERRKSGLIWLDAPLADGPATHVLIIGVGAYQSPKFRKPLTSTTISARAVADWFVGHAKAGFKNPGAPLGSVTLLLSEAGIARPEDQSIYGGGYVPRATFDNAKGAVREWVKRSNTNKDNFVFLYVASHGESYLGRTAILLEDYGLDALDATSGMSEKEQFVGALENAVPVDQLLLFDCCRTPTDMRLPWNEPFGSKLVSLTRSEDDHGQTRQQCVISATAIEKPALGQMAGLTLFADASLQALDGVASDPALENWPVRSANLSGKITDLLALHRLPEEDAQIAPGAATGTFDVSVPGERHDVPVYVFLEDPADWPGSVVSVVASSGQRFTIEGAANSPPFGKVVVPLMTDVVAEARTPSGDLIGPARRKAYAPAVFLKIPKQAAETAFPVRTVDQGGGGRIDISLASQFQVASGAVASIVSRAPGAEVAELRSVPLGGVTSLEVEPGDYSVTLWTPDGLVHQRDVAVEPDQILSVPFSAPTFAHEWLASAAASGAIRGRKRVALVIGNSRYREFPALESAGIDAEVIGGLLRDLGFDVMLHVDLTGVEMASAVRAFGDKAANAGAALFYFSGHDLQFAGENYLVPIDARANSYYTFVGTGQLRAIMSERADVSILLIDRHRLPGGMSRGLLPLGSERLGPIRPDRNENRGESVVVVSTAIGLSAFNPATGRTPFSSALLRHISTPGYSLDDIMRNVADEMREGELQRSQGLPGQAPLLDVDLRKPFYFIPPAGNSSGVPTPPHRDGFGPIPRSQPLAVRYRLADRLRILDGRYSIPEDTDRSMSLELSRDDRWLARIDATDLLDVRYPAQTSSGGLLFVEVECGERRELAVLPSIGNRSQDIEGGWLTYLVVDRFSPVDSALTRVIVEDTRWLGLLGFLGSRSIAMAEKLLNGGLKDEAIEALYGTAIDAMSDKMTNPVAAVAGALVAVAASGADVDTFWDPWLRNLTTWFPTIPDGPIILGRRILMRARNAEHIAEAKRCFFEGFDRGVPFYSMCTEWLARGLESLPGEDAELVGRRRSARVLANLVDSSQAFTVIRAIR